MLYDANGIPVRFIGSKSRNISQLRWSIGVFISSRGRSMEYKLYSGTSTNMGYHSLYHKDWVGKNPKTKLIKRCLSFY